MGLEGLLGAGLKLGMGVERMRRVQRRGMRRVVVVAVAAVVVVVEGRTQKRWALWFAVGG